jgi:hypothetical protein
VRVATLVLKFLLELGALVAYAWTAVGLLGWLIGGIVAVVAIAVFVFVWGRWCAPRAARRLPTSRRIPLELVLLGIGAVALVFVSPLAGIIDAALIALDAVLLTVFRQWEA